MPAALVANDCVRHLTNNLVLTVNWPMTAEDREAENLLENLIIDVCPSATFEYSSILTGGMTAPWLFANGSVYRDITRIRTFVKLVRDCAWSPRKVDVKASTFTF